MEVRVPTLEDVEEVLKDVRFADRSEWYAGTGVLMPTSLEAAIRGSDTVLTAVEDGKPLIMWGSDKDGRLWMFATNAAVPKAHRLHRILRPELDRLIRWYGSVFCFADCRNAVHLKWLRWLGFEELGVIPLGPFELPFASFYKE